MLNNICFFTCIIFEYFDSMISVTGSYCLSVWTDGDSDSGENQWERVCERQRERNNVSDSDGDSNSGENQCVGDRQREECWRENGMEKVE